MGFPRRVLEDEVANQIDRGESAVNILKTILDPDNANGILKLANSLNAAELDRMDLTPEQ